MKQEKRLSEKAASFFLIAVMPGLRISQAGKEQRLPFQTAFFFFFKLSARSSETPICMICDRQYQLDRFYRLRYVHLESGSKCTHTVFGSRMRGECNCR